MSKRKEVSEEGSYKEACKAVKESADDWDALYHLKTEDALFRSNEFSALFLPKYQDIPADELKRRQIHDYKRAWIFRQFSTRRIPGHLQGVAPQQMKLMKMLEGTLDKRQNNAVLLLGHRGCGKSAILRSVLVDLQKKYHRQGVDFCEVYLNGRIQTDDSMAIKEIVRQLSADYDRYGLVKPQFTNEVTALTSMLKDGRYAKLPVFFILDEFHLFAKENARQTLLYLLGDLLQDKTSQIALIGLTCRVDAQELLEKRIRSRMCYRVIIVSHLPTIELLQQAVQESLCLPQIQDLSEGGLEEKITDIAARENELPDPKKISNRDILLHNACVSEFLKSSVFVRKLQHIHAIGRDHRWINSALSLTLRKWNYEMDFPLPQQFVESCDYLARDPVLLSLQSCSVAELALVATMTQLESQNLVSYNFNKIWQTYKSYMHSNEPESIDIFSKVHMFSVFEALIHRQLIQTCDRNLATYMKHTDLVLKQAEDVRLVVAGHRAREALSKCKLPTWLDNWIRKGGVAFTW